MIIHDIIKIKYVQLGFIRKNYPYHLISDEEMFSAFIDLGLDNESNLIDPNTRFFDMYYPNPFDGSGSSSDDNSEEYEDQIYYDAYIKLKNYIINSIKEYLYYHGTEAESDHLIPDWIYTYMLGEVVYQQSEYLDIQDTLELLGCSNLDNEFTKNACIACYIISKKYISTLVTGDRPLTVFGEPHVLKYLRMEN